MVQIDWRKRLGSHLDFLAFLGKTNELFANAEDRRAVAEALAEEDYQRAQELSGLSEEEFVMTLEELDDDSDELLNDEEIQKAVRDFEQEQAMNG